jgi:hypothetical protein
MILVLEGCFEENYELGFKREGKEKSGFSCNHSLNHYSTHIIKFQSD